MAKKWFIQIILFHIFFSSVLSADPVILNSNLNNKNIGKNLEYLVDNDKSLTLNEITSKNKNFKWVQSEMDSLSFGFTKNAYWLRFTVNNPTNKKIQWYIHQEYPLISYITLYSHDKYGKLKVIRAGESYKFSQRPIEYRSFVFPLQTEAKTSQTCYLRFQTGSSMSIVLNLYSPENFEKHVDNETPILWMFYGILIVMFIYNLFIFISAKDISYLFYIIYIISFLLLSMSLNGIAYQYLWPESTWWVKSCRPFLLDFTSAVLILFVFYFTELSKNYSKIINNIIKGFIIANFVFSLTSLFINNYKLNMSFTTALAGITLITMIILFINMAFIKKIRTAQFLITAIFLFLIGTFLFILKTFGILRDTFITNYGFMIGSVAFVVLLSLGLADKINMMRKQIQKAEKKYRHLVESSNDVIFSLDEKLNFLSVNKAMRKHLGFKDEDVIKTNFLNYIQETWSENYNIARQIVEEYTRDLFRDKSTVAFRTSFRTQFSHEPKDLSIKLEYSESEGKIDILGKASPISEDIILQLLEEEKHTYTIDNYLSNAELMSQRLTRNLYKHLKSSEVPPIRVSIREIIINAIEHGNLNISFEEKTQAMMEDNYLNFVKERQKNSENSGKKVNIIYSLTTEMVAYKIIDEGNGFDHENMLKSDAGIADGEFLTHGRGLVMTKETFDEVKFNDKGNQVLLIKYFKDKNEID